MHDRVLVTGGTGKTGRRVARRLIERGVPALVGSRAPASQATAGPDHVRFDWRDLETFDAALDGVRAAYLVAPTDTMDHLPAMRPFLERALADGIERLVLLSAASLPEGGPMMGAVHAWLAGHAPGWTVLRPSWFMQNFSEAQHLAAIRDEGRIYTAAGDGRVPFIDAEDIAAVAVEALTAPGFDNGELVLTGPEALTYDQVAATIGAMTGRPVVHHRLSAAELVTWLEGLGIPPDYAHGLAAMDEAIADGAEDHTTAAVERVVGRPATGFAAFARENARMWGVGPT